MTAPDSTVTCSSCSRALPARDCRIVDGAPVCAACLFGDVAPLEIRPIGVVRNDLAREGRGVQIGRSALSEIHLAPGMARFMAGLAGETGITVVWWAHAAEALETRFRRGWDGKAVGPFASRTPARPNPLAISDVELVDVRDTVLVVRGLDAIDGTPVIDIKASRESLARTLRQPARGGAG